MNPLKAGDIAPKFSLPDQDGEQVNLTDFRGQRVLVLFLPESHDPRLYRYRPAAYAITWMS
ncbi:redoxin domain-containing protein [Escherichia coli]